MWGRLPKVITKCDKHWKTLGQEILNVKRARNFKHTQKGIHFIRNRSRSCESSSDPPFFWGRSTHPFPLHVFTASFSFVIISLLLFLPLNVFCIHLFPSNPWSSLTYKHIYAYIFINLFNHIFITTTQRLSVSLLILCTQYQYFAK